MYDNGRGARRWRALDLGGSIPVYIESEVQRVECPEHGVVVSVIPWARQGSRFTKSFEDSAAWFALYMSKKAVSEYLRIKWETVGAIINRVEAELSKDTDRFDHLINIGIDETSYKKGHKYITVVLNHDTNTVIWVGIGHGKAVLESFFALLTDKQKESIKAVSGDGARWIKDTAEATCPNAVFCIDPFHVVSWVTDILDQVRREVWNDARKWLSTEKKKLRSSKTDCKNKAKVEQLGEVVETVKSSKYPLLMNPENLNENYSAKLELLLLHNRRLATAYRLKEELRLIFKLPAEEVPAAIDKWRRRAWSCRIPQFVELQRKIKRHKRSIIAAVTLGLSNARIEATNNKIKLTIRMAYGFRNLDNLISMIILRCGGLAVDLPGRAA
jgi:transposase